MSPRKLSGSIPPSLATEIALVALFVLIAHLGAASLSGIFFFEDFKHYTARMAYTASRLRAGQLPLWDPYLAFGAPHLAAYYPIGDLIFVALPLKAAINLAPLAHLVLAGTGMVLLCRRWGQGAFSGTLAALVYSLGGFASADLEYLDIVVALSWYPWVLLLADRALETRDRRAAALAAAAFALQTLGGHPQIVLFSILFTGCYTLAFWLGHGGKVSSLLEVSKTFAWIHVLGAGLAGVLLLPFLELMAASQHGSGFGLSKSVSFSIHPLELLGTLVPSVVDAQALVHPHVNGFGAHCLFVGILPLCLVPLGLIGLEWRRTTLLLTALLAIGVGLGQHGPFYPFLFSLPPLSLVRVPPRVLFLHNFAVALLAGFGLDRLLLRRDLKLRLFITLGALLASAMLFALLGTGAVDALTQPASRTLWAASSAVVAAIMLWLPTPRRAPFVAPSLVLLAALIELCLFNGSLRTNRLVPSSVYDSAAATAALIRGVDPSGRAFRIESSKPWTLFQERRGRAEYAPHPAALLVGTLPAQFLVRSAQGQVVPTPGLEPLYERTGHEDDRFPWDVAATLGKLGVKFVISDGPVGGRALKLLGEVGPAFVYENELSLPRAVFACTASGRAAVWTLAGSALPLVPSEGKDACVGSATLRVDEPERVVVDTMSATDGYLILSDTDYPGWNARVNGRPVPILRVQDLVRGVKIPAGPNRVEFVYRPLSVALGFALTASSLLIAVWRLRALYGRGGRVDVNWTSSPQ